MAGEDGSAMIDRTFERIESLFDIGLFGDVKVLVAGCGSGGASVALQLTMSGIRNITLLDNDTVGPENVIRHVCGRRYIGQKKVDAVADVLLDRNPNASIAKVEADIMSYPNLATEIAKADLVVLATDNEPTRYTVNELCVKHGTPFVVGRVFTRGIGGEVFAFRPPDGPCLACLEQFLQRTPFRDGIREIDLVSEEEREKVYGMEIAEIKDSPASPSTSPSSPLCTPASPWMRSRGGYPSALNIWTQSTRTTSFGATGPSIRSKSTFNSNGSTSACRTSARSVRSRASPMLFRSKKPAFSISIACGALESIFDECDKYNSDETGGRLLGTYRHEDGRYEIDVKGVLEPGPNAQRSPTYFLQDGEYQEKLFRAIEAGHPEIEHLGNWHTHHVNGLSTLSGGDKTTYFKTVNHEKHNTDFFYALLVVSKNRGGDPRYTLKHFVFRRDDTAIYEIPATNVRLVDIPVLRPPSPAEHAEAGDVRQRGQQSRQGVPNPERAKDQEFFSGFYPDLKPLLSKHASAPYWKGPLPLVDDSRVEVVAMENPDDPQLSYSIATSSNDPAVTDVLALYRDRKFRSARHAVVQFERDLNRALYRSKKG